MESLLSTTELQEGFNRHQTPDFADWSHAALSLINRKNNCEDSVSRKEKERKETKVRNNMHVTGHAVVESNGDSEFERDKEAYLTSVLGEYEETLARRADKQLGYPVFTYYDDYDALAPLLRFHINNIGDPFTYTNYAMHAKEFEVGVLEWFAKLWEIEVDEYWGYVSNGGTEGNFHGLLIGREILPGGILYASRESHYSIFKAARMFKIECEIISTLTSGQIDLADFRARLLLNKDKPAIINVNIGTTFKGAIDDLDLVLETLHDCDFADDRFYIHCDAALSGLMVSFVKKAPQITFKKPIGSISVSGHKFLGCPMPCGVQMTRKRHINVLSRNIEYIASTDATILGSRSGHTPIFLWYILSKKGNKGIQADVSKCLKNAQYLTDRLRKAGISTMLNELSITVIFERPRDDDFVRRWQLCCLENMAHVVVLPGITIEVMEEFCNELVQNRLTWYPDEMFGPLALQSILEATIVLVHITKNQRLRSKD